MVRTTQSARRSGLCWARFVQGDERLDARDSCDLRKGQTMSDGKLTATFRCLECNQTVELSLSDGYSDESIASCKNCGFVFGTFAEVKAKFESEAAKRARGMASNVFKGLKGWKIT